jgi:hypothetical protein
VKVKVNSGPAATKAAAGVGALGLLGSVIFVILWTIVLAAVAGMTVWLLPVATAGLLVVGFWQALSGLVLLSLWSAVAVRGK